MLTALVPALYVRISPERMTLRNAKTGETLAEVPEIAIHKGAKLKVVGVGREARACAMSPDVSVTNPFAHPRSLVSDYMEGEMVLKALVNRLLRPSLFSASPRIVMHPLGDPEGGFTQVEIRTLYAMAKATGAAKVVMWVGRELNDQEVLSGRLPGDGPVEM